MVHCISWDYIEFIIIAIPTIIMIILWVIANWEKRRKKTEKAIGNHWIEGSWIA